jgi:tRNA A-37 threonylcarbamoyl transferase component Bud32
MPPPASSPVIRSLRSIYRDDRGDFEELLDYGGFRCHLLLTFNPVEPTSPENIPLTRLYDAMTREDEEALESAAGECLDLLWPFMEADYASRLQSNAIPLTIIKLQVLGENGVLRPVDHDVHIEYPATKPVDNIFADVPTFRPSDIERLTEIEDNIFKVRLHNSVYCLKTVHRTGYEGNFIREVTVLQKCSHPNIIRLVGLLVDDKDKVEGMIIDYIDDARSLRDVDSISNEDCERWGEQMLDAITYLHQNKLVWGDAKAANVLIADGNAVLIDFGGGYTKGWVDPVNHETETGDWQGWGEIVKFMTQKIK